MVSGQAPEMIEELNIELDDEPIIISVKLGDGYNEPPTAVKTEENVLWQQFFDSHISILYTLVCKNLGGILINDI